MKLQSYTKTKVLTFNMLHRMNIEPGKATEQLTCIYMFSTLHRYTNNYHSITQKCKLVRYIDFELTMYQTSIQPYKPTTNAQ